VREESDEVSRRARAPRFEVGAVQGDSPGNATPTFPHEQQHKSRGGARSGAGAKPRAESAARNVTFRMSTVELSQLDAYVAKHGRDRSHWVRKALQEIGALRNKFRTGE
jgi:hypothetical protein